MQITTLDSVLPEAIMHTFDFYAVTYLPRHEYLQFEAALMDAIADFNMFGDTTGLLKAALSIPALRGLVVTYIAATWKAIA